MVRERGRSLLAPAPKGALIPLAALPILAALLLPPAADAQAMAWAVRSPDKSLVMAVDLMPPRSEAPAADGPARFPDPDTRPNRLTYTITRGQQTVILQSALGVTLAGDAGTFTEGLGFLRDSRRKVTDRYQLLGGKVRDVSAAGNELTLAFQNRAGREMDLVVRAYDDGIAFRYELPGSGPAAITSEATSFHLPPASTGWVAPYRPNYESYYPQGTTGTDWQQGEFAIPAMFDIGGGQFVLLHESRVEGNYCSSHLTATGGSTFHLALADPRVTGTLPWSTPWRVVITGSLPQVVQSTLVQTLGPPAVPGDTGWIHSGRAAWSWWSQGTGDPALQKHYIDFAHSMGWEYNLVDAGWTDWNNHDPGPVIQDLVKYGADRNVGIILWTFAHDLDTPEKRKARLPLWQSWGVKGIKADFFDSDSQAAMQLREAILEEAWADHLEVNFHGDQPSRGQERHWPNFLTREGVRGAEYYKFGPYPTPTYNCTLPFTRNVVGPMDYTPVTFSTGNRTTTAAHELSLAVVFQSGIQHFADSPEPYNARPLAEELLREVPAAWDETRFLMGYPAQYACLARRKGEDWFIGMNNAGTDRTVQVPLSFLGRGKYHLDLYQDGPTPDSIQKLSFTVQSNSALRIHVPANGGFAGRLVPAQRR